MYEAWLFVVALFDECKFPLAVHPFCFVCAKGWLWGCFAICFIVWWRCFVLFCFYLYGFGVYPMFVFSASVQVMEVVFDLSANPLFCVMWLIGFQPLCWICLAFGCLSVYCCYSFCFAFAMKRHEQMKSKDIYVYQQGGFVRWESIVRMSAIKQSGNFMSKQNRGLQLLLRFQQVVGLWCINLPRGL